MRRAVAFALAALALVCAAPANASRTVAVDAAGAVHAYVAGADGALYHAPPGGVLARVGGTALAQQPVAVERDGQGRLLVVARAEDGALLALPDGDWSARVPVATGAAGSPELLVLSDGKLALFYRGVDGRLWSVTQAADGWESPVSLADDAAGDPTAILDHNGAIFVVYRSTTGEIVTPDGLQNLGPAASDPAVVRYPDGRLEVFARAADGTLWRAAQELPLFAFGPAAPLAAGPVTGNPAAVLDGARNLHVFARDAAGTLRELTGATSLGGSLSGDPAAIRNRFGLIEVFAPSGSAWLTRAQSAVLTWEPGFRALGEAAPAGDPPPVPLQAVPVPVPVVVPPTYAPRRLLVDVRADAKAGRTSTVFRALTVRGVPAGATVTATCGKGCKRTSLSFKNVAGTVSLKSFFAKRAKQGTLKAGTKIRVVVSAPNMIAAVKTLTVRPRKAPTVATRCLAPGAAAETLCAA